MSARDPDDPNERGGVREWLTFPGGRRPDKLPGEVKPGRRTKSGELAARGWRILPIPCFCERGTMWHDPATGAGNRAFISWSLAREFLIIPPEDNPRPAWKVEGCIRAICEAAREARIA